MNMTVILDKQVRRSVADKVTNLSQRVNVGDLTPDGPQSPSAEKQLLEAEQGSPVEIGS
jgi:hypothetical protein